MSHWLTATDGVFSDASRWSNGKLPQLGEDATLDAKGGPYTVTVLESGGARSVQTAANATLSIQSFFGTSEGTGAGANAGSIVIGSGGIWSVANYLQNPTVIKNTGSIRLNATTDNALLNLATYIAPNGAYSLVGGGSIVMSDSALNGIVSLTGDAVAVLTNLDNVISGSGDIGGGGNSYLYGAGGSVLPALPMSFINKAAGVINATGTLNPLRIDTFGQVDTNSGLIEATGAAGLDIAATTISQTSGGVILATAGSTVRIESSTVKGGTLKTTGTGLIETSGGSTLSAVKIDGVLAAADGETLTLAGKITNIGEIALFGNAAGSTLQVLAASPATLGGGGTVALGDFSGNGITADLATGKLTNVDNLILGDGDIGRGRLTLVNQAAGRIVETGSSGLTIDTGAATITNAGLIKSQGAGGVMIDSKLTNSGTVTSTGSGGLMMLAAVTNTGVIEEAGTGAMQSVGAIKNNGTLKVSAGVFTVFGGVTGTGSAVIAGGTLAFANTFNQAVSFTGAIGTLQLAKSQTYTAAISGLSTAGGTLLDLRDIKFVSAGEATFVDNGLHTGGVLTVSDGVHSAHLNLVGDYHASSFVAAVDGHGGVMIHDPAAASPSAFAAAMASFGTRAAATVTPLADLGGRQAAMLSIPGSGVA